MRVPISGRVEQVSVGAGPRLGSWWAQPVRLFVAVVVVPASLLVIALVKFSFAIAGSFAGRREPRSSSDFTNDLLAYVGAHWIMRSRDVPVTVARIRDGSGRLHEVRFEGHFVSGTIAAGDDLSLIVTLRRGVRVVVDGENRTLGAPIRMRT